MAQENKENKKKPENNSKNYEEVRTSVRYSPFQKMEADGAAGTSL